MDMFFFLLSVACLIVLVIGLIKPGLVIKWGLEENKTKKTVMKYYGIGFVLFFILFMANIDNTKTNNASTGTTTTTSNKEDQATKDKKAAADMDTLITNLGTPDAITLTSSTKVKTVRAAYNTLTDAQKALVTKLNDLTAMENKITTLQAEADKVAYDTGITYDQLARTPDNYKGKKVKFTGKVIQVMESSGETDLRIAVNGDYDTVLLVAYDPSITSTRVLEDDNVTIKGISNGLYTYKSTMSGNITIPLIKVDIININQ